MLSKRTGADVGKIFTSLGLIITLLIQNFFVFPVNHGDNVLLKAVLIADIHADADFARDRTNLMRQYFAAIGRTQNDADTVVMAGDLTNSGDAREYINLQNCLRFYCRIRDRVPAFGNHDSWHHSDDPDFAKAEKYFKRFCKRNRIKTDTVYYVKYVRTVPFIVLGVEAGDFDTPYHSEAQLTWFEETLNAETAKGQPVFVICHKDPTRLGDAAERIGNILNAAAANAAAPIIFVSGHCHEIGENTFAQPSDRLVLLNLPSVQYTEDGGLGFVAELTDGKVTLTGMNFLSDEPLEGYRYEIAY